MEKTKSLAYRKHELTDVARQLELLNEGSSTLEQLPKFEEKVDAIGLYPLTPTGIEIFQVNVGYLCNMTCKHCHVDAGPDRKEVMTKENLQHCLNAIEGTDIETVDITGGAPEMNPHFKWFVEQISAMGKHVIVRSNLTILVSNMEFQTYTEFFAKHGVEVTCSLPFYSKRTTDRQRGKGTYDKSIEALKVLNELGYGFADSGLELNLVYNPAGAFLPASQASLEKDFKRELLNEHGIVFNKLFTITNLPISRYLDYLVVSGNLDEYMTKLVNAFNPAAAANVMCRNTISVGWDGALYDCDFNQMLEMKVSDEAPQHVRDFDAYLLNKREIKLNQHCYGCTAGAGSSCGGATA